MLWYDSVKYLTFYVLKYQRNFLAINLLEYQQQEHL